MTPRTIATAAGPDDLECLVSPEGHERLVRQLAGLRELRSGELRERMRAAVADGDPEEQLAIREEEAALDARIASLDRLIGRLEVVDAGQLEGAVVLGATVTLRDEASGATHEHVLVGTHEADVPRAMSIASPVGRAVLGRRVGDTVEVELPGGRSRRLTVVGSVVAPSSGQDS